MGKTVIIVGGVAGGATAAARLRRLEPDTRIILFERGDYISYANCGLPYFVGGLVEAADKLLVHTPASLHEKYDIDVRAGQEVVGLDPAAKTVSVQPGEGEAYTERYDVLLLSPGASPFTPPVPGAEGDKISHLWTVPDAKRVRAWTQSGVRSVLLVGAGFIGLEGAENLKEAGMRVQVAEMADQVLPPLDPEMAKPIAEHLEAKGVELLLRDGISAIRQADEGLIVTMASGKGLRTDRVVLAAGARPNTALARAAGLAIGPAGGILVDEYLRTSDASIYAIGDAAETRSIVTGGTTITPLAGPANQQGRIAAENIAGGGAVYNGSQGTAIVKVFEKAAAVTGLSEKGLKKQGLQKDTGYKTVTIEQSARVGYYPGGGAIKLKLLFTPGGEKLLGAQAVGEAAVDKCIDVLATALRLGAGVDELAALELAYAPPFSTTRHPVNTLAYAAQKVLGGRG